LHPAVRIHRTNLPFAFIAPTNLLLAFFEPTFNNIVLTSNCCTFLNAQYALNIMENLSPFTQWYYTVHY